MAKAGGARKRAPVYVWWILGLEVLAALLLSLLLVMLRGLE
ncbi:MAG TPA: hypothetical protein VJ715_17245 [Pyrinomonadaceae bacterium]|nr:hypothetical protein [Pyrinomonadaceae bacterium]